MGLSCLRLCWQGEREAGAGVRPERGVRERECGVATEHPAGHARLGGILLCEEG